MLTLSDTIVEWDTQNKKQIDEAKKLYIEALKQNRKVLNINGNKIGIFYSDLGYIKIAEPEINSEQILTQLLNENGDERVIWNLANKKEIKEAMERFQNYLDKGWKAYAVKEDGKKGQRIFNFDPNLEEVSFDNQSVKMRLKDFAKAFKKITVLPESIPG